MIARIGITCLTLALSAAASPARAQTELNDPAAAPGASAQAPASRLGPMLDGNISGVHHSAAPLSPPAARAADHRPHVGRHAAHMIGGGAGLVVGAIIGGTPGTLFMIAGGGTLLYGLYEYLQ